MIQTIGKHSKMQLRKLLCIKLAAALNALPLQSLKKIMMKPVVEQRVEEVLEKRRMKKKGRKGKKMRRRRKRKGKKGKMAE